MEDDNDKARPEATFRYVIYNVKTVQDCILSPPFYVRNLPWKILVRTRKVSPREGRQRSLGFFLQCNGESETLNWSCYAMAELRLISHDPNAKPFSRKLQHLFYSEERDWGYTNFMLWANVVDPRNSYVQDNTITLEVHITADAPHAVAWDPKKHTGFVARI